MIAQAMKLAGMSLAYAVSVPLLLGVRLAVIAWQDRQKADHE